MSKLNHHIDHKPPASAERLLLWFLHDDLVEEVLGDLDEKFFQTCEKQSLKKAKRNYWYQVIHYLRPFAIKTFKSKLNNITMVKHNFKISYRQMLRNKGYSLINIGGLAMGMVVAMLIGLWVNDELAFNKYHDNYDQIVQIFRQENDGTERFTSPFLATGIGALLKEKFPERLSDLSMIRSRSQSRVLGAGENRFTFEGHFIEAPGPDLLGLKLKYGQIDGLKDLNTIMLSESAAYGLFGETDPTGKLVKMNAGRELEVVAVYEDLPGNSTFKEKDFFAPLLRLFGGNEGSLNVWNNYNIYIYAKMQENADLAQLSTLVNNTIRERLGERADDRDSRFIVHPMTEWHKTEFRKDEVVVSQAYKFIWLYAIIGLCVLVLACINFMNLSTARSEKRAKEVGIRKTLGSIRKQLISQFYMESMLYTLLAFVLSLGLLWALLPWFNETSGKRMDAPWALTEFWLLSIGFVLFTAIIAGSYPAAYLSSFKPIKALRGTLAAGKYAALPRKVLVVFQFTISVALIIGTITVNNQIQEAKDRPIGYSPEGMISLRPASPNYGKNRKLLRTELMNTGVVKAVGMSNYPVISTLGWNGGFTWEGMDPGFTSSFNTITISHGYGDAVGLEFIAGRDFSEEFETDKNAILINRSAMEAMKLENPVGTVVRYAPGWTDPRNYTIIGVVEDMIKGSPFQQTDQSVMFLDQEFTSWMYIRVNPDLSASQALPEIQEVFNTILPEAPFNFKFADDDYMAKFEAEQRIGGLAGFFTLLAIFISCLGLFGLASYVAEQRTKEIGIRKVLGASVTSLWKLLSKDFTLLVLISCLISIPIAYSVLDGWLETYEVRTKLYWWTFALAAIGALLVTIITVSFQAVKASVANPVKALRSE
ncbi:MAG: FtsX-like permease family protein [Roseivirga sp.]|nr:FtsX-like permease family protein [Roseivirga sp.]